ncbi:hypothetical protein P7C70_g9303, partial [Phenoliferia sp. Uapishka_3]
MASRVAKPAGSYHLLPSAVSAFLAPLPVDRLPGVGYSTKEKLEEKLGVTTIGGLLEVPRKMLQDAIGKQNGERFEAFARGVDDRELEGKKARGSVGAEVNYGIRFENQGEVEKFVLALGMEVAARLKKEGLRCRHLTLKVMKRHPTAPIESAKFLGHGHCDTHSVSSPVSAPGSSGKATDDGEVFGAAAWKAMQGLGFPPNELRGIGISLTKLEGENVAVVRERGQGMLSFGVVAKPDSPTKKLAPLEGKSSEAKSPAQVNASSLKAVPDPFELPPPGQPTRTSTRTLKKDVSVIVLDDSDSDDAPSIRRRLPTPPTKVLPRKKGKVKAVVGPKIAPMFRATKASVKAPPKVTDAELKSLGIDAGYYKGLDAKYQAEVLATARASVFSELKKRSKAVVEDADKDAKMNGKAIKLAVAGASSRVSPPIPRSPSPRPAVETLVVSSSPTDEHIAGLGFDLDAYNALPKDMAREQLKFREALQVKQHSRPMHLRDNRGSSYTIDVPVVPAQVFLNKKKKSSLDDVRSFLEAWVDAGSAPVDEDVNVLQEFLERCLDRKLGMDMAKAVGVVNWLTFLVAEKYGKEGGGDGDG